MAVDKLDVDEKGTPHEVLTAIPDASNTWELFRTLEPLPPERSRADPRIGATAL